MPFHDKDVNTAATVSFFCNTIEDVYTQKIYVFLPTALEPTAVRFEKKNNI